MRMTLEDGLAGGWTIHSFTPGQLAGCVAIESTYSLHGRAEPVQPGGPDSLSSSDPVPFKPRADVIVVAGAGTSDGNSATLLPARIKIGPVDKTLTAPDRVGFGPINPAAQIPKGIWFPETFDYGSFNAAPRDQQVDDFLKGDEELLLENLVAGHAAYRRRLPARRIRCFLQEADRDGQTGVREVALSLDTLSIDLEAETMRLGRPRTLPSPGRLQRVLVSTRRPLNSTAIWPKRKRRSPTTRLQRVPPWGRRADRTSLSRRSPFT
jgi:hypothetical protein